MKKCYKVIVKDSLNDPTALEYHGLPLKYAVRIALQYSIAYVREDDDIWQY